MKRSIPRPKFSRSTELVPKAHRFLGAAVIAAFAASASAQLQFAELAKRGLPASEDYTQATALGDVDGDGDPDLIVGSYYGQSRLYLNNGSGTFTDATAGRMPVGSYSTTSLALGDVDGDGDLDLVVGNGGVARGQSLLYLNNGTGTFTDATATHLPTGSYTTHSLALGDVDGDGDLDLVVGNNDCSGPSGCYGEQSRLYLNNGNGTFSDATASRMPVGLYVTTSLALGDVDADGDLDLVVGNRDRYASGSRLYLNNGTGTFTDTTASAMPVGSYPADSLQLGDVDGDGDLDLVVGVYGQSHLFLNNGVGVFTDATASNMPSVGYGTMSLALGDVDGDGDLDLVVGNYGEQSRLYRNNGVGVFTDATASNMPSVGYGTMSLALGDVDTDGDLDLIVGNWGRQSRLCVNNGAGSFTDATASRFPGGHHDTRALAVGDVDADGDLDVILGTHAFLTPQHLVLWRNDGSGTFTDATASAMPMGNYYTRTQALALGDVDGDGDLDLVVGNELTQSLLYRNNGTGTFTDATATHMPTGSYATNSLALGDVDGDGDLDLVVGNGSLFPAQQSLLYRNNGAGVFTDVTASSMPIGSYATTSLALGDVDADGDLDLVVGNSTPRQSRLYLNNGAGAFTDATASRLPIGNEATNAVVLGDVDGDGDLDLLLGGSQNRLYLNNGAGTFTDATASRMPVGNHITSSLGLADLDDDGDLDLVLGNGNSRSAQQSSFYVNNGTGTFTDATAARMPANRYFTSALALGDMDRDGDLDLVLGNTWQSRLYLNLLRQLDTPRVLHRGRNYQLDVYSRYGPTTTTEIAFPFASTATASIPLPPFGTLGVDPALMIALPPFQVAQPAGLGSLSLPIPNLPIFGGLSIYTQVLLQQQPVQARFTNVIGDVFLR